MLAVKAVGQSKIGGNWSLVDHQGEVKTRASFKGKYLLIYFGFTFCPDVCPVELKKMAHVVDRLDKELKRPDLIQPLFISLDPWRDSVDQIRTYVKQFHPRLLGLTGTPAQCEEIAKNFRVFVDARNKEREFEEDYVVDHSIWVYMLDKEGKYADIFGVDLDGDDVVEKVKSHLYSRNELKEPLWRKIKNFFTMED